MLRYWYFHAKSSGELHFLFQPVLNFRAKTRKFTHIVAKHSLSLRSLFLKYKFDFNNFFPRTATFLNLAPWVLFSDPYNLKLFKSRVHRYLPTYLHKLCHLNLALKSSTSGDSWALYRLNIIVKKRYFITSFRVSIYRHECMYSIHLE